MIFFPEQNIAIITPPHTASGNLHKSLCTEKYGGQWVIGPCLYTGNVNHHYAELPVGWIHDGCKVVVVIRDPYDRLVGLYKHYQWWAERNEAEKIKTFSQYVFHRPPAWMHHKRIIDFILDNKITGYETIRYESLTSDLEELLETSIELLPRYHEPNIIDQWYDEERLIKCVNRTWAKKDCINFGYEVIDGIIKQ